MLYSVQSSLRVPYGLQNIAMSNVWSDGCHGTVVYIQLLFYLWYKHTDVSVDIVNDVLIVTPVLIFTELPVTVKENLLLRHVHYTYAYYFSLNDYTV